MKPWLALLLAGCGAAQTAGRPGPGAVAFVAVGGVAVPVACAGSSGIERRGCLERVPAGARVRYATHQTALGADATTPCGPGRTLAVADGTLAVWPPMIYTAEPAGDATPAEIARIELQLRRTDPTLRGPMTVSGVVRGDLDGDGHPDAAFAAGLPGLSAVVVLPGLGGEAARVRLLQFSDEGTYALAGAVDLDPEVPGLQLVIRIGGDIDVVKATGESIGGAHCEGR